MPTIDWERFKELTGRAKYVGLTEAEVEFRLVEIGSFEFDGVGVALCRHFADGDATGIAQPEHFADFVERFPGGIIAGLPHQGNFHMAGYVIDGRVTSGNEQRYKGEGWGIGL